MTASPQLAAALEYAARGWAVFPLQPGLKEPLRGTRGHLDATTDRAQIEAWWTQNPNYNLGISLAPSGLYVLDVDVSEYDYVDKATGEKRRAKKRGAESLARIEHELTPTLLATTGRGGTHVVYACPPGVEPHRHIGIIEKNSGLDLLGEGYIVAAPSYLAETGTYYQWSQQCPIAPLPTYLSTIARQPRVAEKVQSTGTPIETGGRNNAMFRLACALRETGIGAEALARALDAENKQRFSPPLDDFELAGIVNSALNRVEVRRDVAAGAIVAQEVQQIFAPPQRSMWLEDVAREPVPPVTFYSTGFAKLDELLAGGFATRQMCGIIGPPSAGKSALVGHWLRRLSLQRPVLHGSIELPRHEVFVRYAANALEFPWVEGIKGRVPQEHMAGAVRGVRIKVFGQEDVDPNDPWGSIAATVEAMRQECGVAPIVAIDYLQLLARGAADQMRHKVGELSAAGRRLSQQFDTLVLAVLTTSRDAYGGKNAEAMRTANDPTVYLRAAKESGDIEFDCATLMYLDVDKLHDGPDKPARLAVARCRYGNVGFCGLRAQLAYGKFYEDETALKAFDAETRKERAAAESLEASCQRLLDTVDKLAGCAIADLQKHAKLSGTLWSNARDKLLADGVIYEDEVRVDGRRVPNAKTLRRRNSPASEPVAPHEEEPL